MSKVQSRVVAQNASDLTLPQHFFAMVADLIERRAVHDDDYEFFSIYAPEKAVFIDVGSNIGNSAISISNRCPNAQILGFEANRLLEPFLANEAARNKNYNYKLVGLGSTAGAMDLFIPIVDHSPIFGEASTLLDHFSDSIVVDRLKSYSTSRDFTLVQSSCTIETLDQQAHVFETARAATHRVVKIDVEGAELSVLQGGVNFIQNFRPTFLIEDAGRPEIVSFLADLGYSRYFVNTENHHPEEAFGRDAINSLFVHRRVF